MTGRPRRVLMSAPAAEALAARLDSLRQRPGTPAFEVLRLDVARDDPTLQVDAAFISRDITGLSTKTQLTESVLQTYAVLRRSPGLSWVHTHSAGADRPIYAELGARGVAVTTSAGTNAPLVAQTALAGLLALSRRLPQLAQAQRERRWAPLIAGPLPPDLAGQTVLLVGWGAIARTLQPLLTMLGLQVVVLRRSAEPAAPGLETHPYEAIGALLPRADWVVLACPLQPRTHHLLDAAALARVKPGAMLVNVARGEVVDEPALIAALADGRLAGACLDVFESEPLAPESPLWSLPNTLVWPHSAGMGAGNAARVSALFADNLERWLLGQPLLNAVEAAAPAPEPERGSGP